MVEIDDWNCRACTKVQNKKKPTSNTAPRTDELLQCYKDTVSGIHHTWFIWEGRYLFDH
jgi:hypothetical protein